jgi:hypothetical protein
MRNTVTPGAWRMLKNLTTAVDRHAKSHEFKDFDEYCKAEEALAHYINLLENMSVRLLEMGTTFDFEAFVAEWKESL